MNAPLDSTHSGTSLIDTAIDAAERIILGKPEQIRLAICCLLAQGHVLVEDMPGMGKTTLSHTLAKIFGLDFQRIQFTSDLLPADILGVSIFDNQNQSFHFHPGPIFSAFVLADEINRATPKTQSALLEAMEEKQITIEGQTHALPQPFFVMGTQNPLEQSGTFALPESQLDRFMMRLSLGHPAPEAERELLAGQDRRQMLLQQSAVLSPTQLMQLQQQVQTVRTSDALLDYLQALLQQSRDSERFVYGLSPRAGLSMVQAARAWALMHGRDYVEPEDLKQVFKPVAEHRLLVADDQQRSLHDLLQDVLDQTAIP